MTRHCGTVSGAAGWKLDPEVEPREMLTDRGRRFLTLITSRESVALLRTVTAEAERFPELGRAFLETGPKRWAGSCEIGRAACRERVWQDVAIPWGGGYLKKTQKT